MITGFLAFIWIIISGEFLTSKKFIITSKLVKHYKEFKLDALHLLQESKSISEISNNLIISINTLSTWRKRYQLHGDQTFQGLGARLLKTNNRKNLEVSRKKILIKNGA